MFRWRWWWRLKEQGTLHRELERRGTAGGESRGECESLYELAAWIYPGEAKLKEDRLNTRERVSEKSRMSVGASCCNPGDREEVESGSEDWELGTWRLSDMERRPRLAEKLENWSQGVCSKENPDDLTHKQRRSTASSFYLQPLMSFN